MSTFSHQDFILYQNIYKLHCFSYQNNWTIVGSGIQLNLCTWLGFKAI